jgi:hypothetical protein
MAKEKNKTLEEQLAELELIEAQQMDALKESGKNFLHQLTPGRLAFHAWHAKGVQPAILETAVAAGTGLLGRKLLFRHSGNFLKKAGSTAFQFLITNFIRNKMRQQRTKHDGEAI